MIARFPRLDMLPPAQRRLWSRLGVVGSEGFVLYGGTAIALRLGHRQSVDFDFFSDRSFQPADLIHRFGFLNGAQIIQEAADTLTVLAGSAGGEQVKLSFFGGLGFGRLAQPDADPNTAVQIASLQDLLAHKLKVLLQRVESKDYLDIYAILLNGGSLAQGLAGAQALFGSTYPLQEPLKALSYFQGGDLNQLTDEIKRRLTSAASSVRNIHSVKIADRKLMARST